MKCEECNLPMVECNALVVARRAAVKYLRQRGYAAVKAQDRIDDLIPDTKNRN